MFYPTADIQTKFEINLKNWILIYREKNDRQTYGQRDRQTDGRLDERKDRWTNG